MHDTYLHTGGNSKRDSVHLVLYLYLYTMYMAEKLLEWECVLFRIKKILFSYRDFDIVRIRSG
jgi:hypothetical protein